MRRTGLSYGMPHMPSVTTLCVKPSPRMNRPSAIVLSVRARCASWIGCWFWIGSSQFALKDYKGAISSHETLVAKYPDNSRVPDALLNIGYAQAESGDRNAARKSLQSLIQRYPQSPAAQLARDRLASLPATTNNR